MKNWINGLALFAGIVSLGNAVDLEKVRQLQELGFSNEQIVEMLKTGTPETAGGSATQAPASQMSPEVLQHFGEDIVMSGEHRSSVNQIASQFGERLSEIKIQHND